VFDVLPNPSNLPFREQLRHDFDQYLQAESLRFRHEDCLRIDFHCHDHHSDVPDELWGRILRLPETWLKTGKLVKVLQANGSDVITVTNHNNARSCWKLMEKGHDVLSGAEFTCYFPEYELYMHVLAYGFTPAQEAVLNQKRADVYDFLRYAAEHRLPVILPHPLYFYSNISHFRPELFEKLALIFQRFEVLNGQRDLWQSVLTLRWAQGLSPEKMAGYAKKHQINPQDFGVDISLPKTLTGGSDDHVGLFAGQCGSRLWVPDLAVRRQTTPLSKLALEAMRNHHVSPFGDVGDNQKLGLALLDYFCEVANKMEDPGLLRMLFHRGELSDKLACFAIANGMLELKKNKRAQVFTECLHNALRGKKPDWLIRWNISNDYRFCIQGLEKIAEASKKPADQYAQTVHDSLQAMFTDTCKLLIGRISSHSKGFEGLQTSDFSTENLTRAFEVPSQISQLFGSLGKDGKALTSLLDDVAFPALIASVLAGAQFGSAHVLYKNRGFLNEFAEGLDQHSIQHPKRMLYLTDTLRDKNGVSNSLSGKLAEIQRRDYPVDFLICHESAEAEPHLHVVRPLVSFSFAQYGEQAFRVPDLLEIANRFYQGGYDRVICSTEGPMVLVALFLKAMFNVPAFFFMHTDWLDFVKHTTNLNQHERDRVRRLLRALYHQFDGVFVLNSDHRDWLTSHAIGVPAEKVFLTAHHTEALGVQAEAVDKQSLFADATPHTPVLLYVGRLSKEKGVLELPSLLHQVRQQHPDVRLVVAGSGPAESQLRQALPEAHFTGWIAKADLLKLYAGLDLFVFPSQFDTFGNVILEAFAQGMPVVAYDCKGPKDLIQHGVSGYLVSTPDEMAEKIGQHLSQDPTAMRQKARLRVLDYQAKPIMERFLADMGLPVAPSTTVLPA
jgi:glycosyltransferase involved in cell wall biosynthesis